MKVIETVVYEFNELSDKAKQRAREWFLCGADETSDAWDLTIEDAENVGLKIDQLFSYAQNVGRFMESAESCARLIIENHGPQCDTHRAAKWFLDAIGADEGRNGDEIEKHFLDELLACYRKMYESDLEYRSTDEYVDEAIQANEYTFTSDGVRFG